MRRILEILAWSLFTILFAVLAAPCMAGSAMAPNEMHVGEITAEYRGEAAYLLKDDDTLPLSLTAGDFDGDGLPDLVVGYGHGEIGLIVLHRGNFEAIYPSHGGPAGEPFLREAVVVPTAQPADFLGSGDFDADGHLDVVLARRGGTDIHLHRGDGHGAFAEAQVIPVEGRLTAMTVGEVNRRDGLADVVVGVDDWDHPHVLVFEWPEGTFRGAPERIAVHGPIHEIELRRVDEDGYSDVVVSSIEKVGLIRGRDRELTSTATVRAGVASPVVEAWSSSANKTASTSPVGAGLPPGAILSSVEMRLNRDALPDFVVIIEGEDEVRVVKSLERTVFTVDSTADDPDFDTGDGVCDTDDSVGDGPCTLRAAIEQANAAVGADAIEFNIAGSGPHTIQPGSPLPQVLEAVTVDGYTQPGASANTIAFPGGVDTVLQVELDGSLVPIGNNGLSFTADFNTVRGLVINGFLESGVTGGSGIELWEASNNVIEGNFLGCDVSGTTHRQNGKGLKLWNGADNNTIGGSAPAARNIISGNASHGIWLWGSHNVVQGNLIGSDLTGTQHLYSAPYGVFLYIGSSNTVGGGTSPAGNLIVNHTGDGVLVYASDSLIQGNIIGTDITGAGWLANGNGIEVRSSSNSQIGGTAPGQGNLISNNNDSGVYLENAPGTRILGNRIGTQADGVSPRGNGADGVKIASAGATGIEVGGTVPGSGNVIAHNGWSGFPCNGIEVFFTSSTGNSILGNSIFASHQWCLGVELGNDGVTANDPGDGDTGPNNYQNFPVITGVAGLGNLVQGSLNSTPSTEFHVEFFASPVCHYSGNGDGQLFLGSDSVTTDAVGNVSFSSSVPTSAPGGSYITSTATAPDGSTSEFSACYQYTPSADLGITKDNGVTEVMPGGQVTYTMVASNAGPDDLPGALMSDGFGTFLSCSWTCVAAGGATCSPGPSTADIEEYINLPVGGTATYTAVCDIEHTAIGFVENWAEVILPDGANDPNGSNNEANDTDTVLGIDYGDAPDPSFPTLWDSDGARHLLGGGLFLGASADADSDGQPSTGADGDDADGSDDEDGVTFTSVAMTGYTASMDVEASAAGVINVWLDLDRNGSWLDVGEQIFIDEPVVAGTNPLAFPVPATAALGDSYARFRLDSAGGLNPQGFAADGEVEDELVEIRYSTLDVAETGQITSYAAGDDGTFQMGVPWPEPRFVDNGDGSVTDELTGLMWTQDNVNPGPAPCGPGVTRNWFDSLTYVDCLNANAYLSHDDWRMPNIVEMNSLMHFREYDLRPWWHGQGFTMTTNYRWWSSTTPPTGLSKAHSLSAFGSTSGVNKATVSGTAVWPVRGGPGGGAVQLQATGQVRCWNASWSEVPCVGTGQDGEYLAGAAWPSPRFEVTGDCVTDRLTGLMWTKDADPFGARSWYNALDDALGLSLCGYDDWRLPSVLELRTLMHHDKRTDLVPGNLHDWWESQGFVNVPANNPPWSGTSHAGDPANVAWGMFSDDSKNRDDHLVVWPVRGNLQFDTSDLAVVMTDSADPVDPGDNVSYTVDVSNLGPNSAIDVVVTTSLPNGSTFVNASGSGWSCGEVDLLVSCTMATLTVGVAAPISIEITTPLLPGTMLSSTTVVDSLQDDPVGENNSAVETTQVVGYDFGDAPDPSYPTLLVSDGARHLLGGALFLGAAVDTEPDGQPTAGADGDDLDGGDDEDGVAIAPVLLAGVDETIQVTASVAGMLSAWIDFNADGDWDDVGEQVFTDEPLVAGSNGLSVMIPLDATVGTTFGRFRFDSAGGLTPTGLAADGEVEDYAVVIDPSAELEVDIADSPDPVPEGGRLTYFVSVTNNGQLEASSVVLTDTLPPEVSFVAANLPACVEAGGVVTCDLVTLSAGGSTTIEIEVDVVFGSTGTITNTADVALNETDPVLGNNTEDEITTVVDESTYIFSDGFETGDTSRWSATG